MDKFANCLLLIVLILGACTPAADEYEQARQTLIDFFDLLKQGAYDDADQLYAGDYQLMVNNNPSVDPANHGTLWENVCTLNGFKCLAVRSAKLMEKNEGIYIFTVEFNNPDGSLFM